MSFWERQILARALNGYPTIMVQICLPKPYALSFVPIQRVAQLLTHLSTVMNNDADIMMLTVMMTPMLTSNWGEGEQKWCVG